MSNTTYTVAEYLSRHNANTLSGPIDIRDTGANLATLTTQTIGYFSADKVNSLDASDDYVAFTDAQYEAVRAQGVTFTTLDTVAILVDPVALPTAKYAGYAARGVDVLATSTISKAWTLSVAQYKDIITAGLGLAGGDTVTIKDAAANLKSLDLAALAGKGVDVIDSNDGPLELTVAQATSLGAVAFGATNEARIVDTGPVIQGLTKVQIAALSVGGLDKIALAAGQGIQLSVDQATSLGNVRITGDAHAATLADSGLKVTSLTVTQINALKTNGVADINLSDDAVNLTVAQLGAISAQGIAFASEDRITLSDTAANLATLAADAIGKLKGSQVFGVTVLDGNSLSLDAARTAKLDLKITSTGPVILSDIGAEIKDKLDATKLGALSAGLGFTLINVSDNALNLNVQQHRAIYDTALRFAADDVVAILDTAANLKQLTTTDLTQLYDRGVKSIQSTENLFLTVEQYDKLVEKGFTFKAADGQSIVLSDARINLEKLLTTELGALKGKGFASIDSTDDALSLSVEKYQKLMSTGVALTSDDAVTLIDLGSNIQTLSADDFGKLKTNGVDYLSLRADGNGAKSLTLDKVKWDAFFSSGGQFDADTRAVAIKGAENNSPTIKLSDTSQNIQSLDPDHLGKIIGAGVVIDATDDKLTLDQAHYKAIIDATTTSGDQRYWLFSDADVVTLSLTQNEIANLQASALADLSKIGVDKIVSAEANHTLTLSKAQYDSLIAPVTGLTNGWVSRASVAADDLVSVTMSKAELEGRDAAYLGALAANKIDKIALSSASVVTFTAEQARALGAVVIANAASVTLSDTGQNIANLSATVFADLVASGITKIDASDNALNLTVAQYQAIAGTSLKLDAGDVVTLRDKADFIAERNPAQLGALSGNGVDAIYTTDKMLSLTVEKAVALGGTIVVDHAGHAPAAPDAAPDFAGPYFEILDTSANISKLTKAQLQALNNNKLDQINSSDAKISLSSEALMALDKIKIATGDVVTLFDGGANIAKIDYSKLSAIGAAGVTNSIDASDNALSLSLAQFRALVGATNWRLSDNDVVTLRDAQVELAKLTVDEILGPVTNTQTGVRDATKGLTARGVDQLSTTANDRAFSISLAQYDALVQTSCTLLADDTVTLGGLTQADLDAKSTAWLTALAKNHIDKIGIANNADLSLNAANYFALGAVALVTNGVFTLKDTAEVLSKLNPDQIGGLAGKSVDVIKVSDGATLKLTVEQYRKLGAVALTEGDRVVLSDTVANLDTLQKSEIAGLTAKFVDAIEATNGPLSLTVEKALALGSVTFDTTNLVKIVDTVAHIADLTDNDIKSLDAAGLDWIDATDKDAQITLSIAQAKALGGIKIAADDYVVVVDTADNIATTLTPADITAFITHGVDEIRVGSEEGATSIDALVLTVVQAKALGVIKLGEASITYHDEDSKQDVTLTSKSRIEDTAANIKTLTAPDLTALANSGLDGIIVSDNAPLTLSLAQARALTLTHAEQSGYAVDQRIFTSGDVTVEDTGIAIAGLSARELGYLSDVGVDSINISGDGSVSITVAQYRALGDVYFGGGSKVTLSDTVVNLSLLSVSEFKELSSYGVDLINASDGTLDLSADKATALPSNISFTNTNPLCLVDKGAEVS